MTSEQLETLNKDIESGLVMTVTTTHYAEMEAENNRMKTALNKIMAREQGCGRHSGGQYTSWSIACEALKGKD